MPALCDPWRMDSKARAALRRSSTEILAAAGLDVLLEELRQAREDLARERDDAALAAAKTGRLVQELKDDAARMARERDALEAACARLEDERAAAVEALERARDVRAAPAAEEAEPADEGLEPEAMAEGPEPAGEEPAPEVTVEDPEPADRRWTAGFTVRRRPRGLAVRGFTEAEQAALEAVPAERVTRIPSPRRFEGGMLDAMLRERMGRLG